jgi:hypothetical protein
MYAHPRLIAESNVDDREVRHHEALVAQTLADSYRFRQALEDDVRQARERTAAAWAETESERAYAGALKRRLVTMGDLVGRSAAEAAEQAEAVQALTEEIRRRDEGMDRLRRWLDAEHASASRRLTAPLRAVKHGIQRLWRVRSESALPAYDQSLLAGWSVRRIWWLAFTLSMLIAVTDAILDNGVILVALLGTGPFCGLLTGRWIRTATIAIWTVALAVLLCIPDEIWDTSAQLVNVSVVVAAGLLSTAAASFIERRRRWA